MNGNIANSFLYFLEAFFNLAIILFILLVAINVKKRIESARTKKTFKLYFFSYKLLLVSAAFASLGFTIGLLIGLSQSPVVSATIPALMGFYGGFVTYLFAK